MEKRESEERWTRLLERQRWSASDAKWALEEWSASGEELTRFAGERGIDPNRLIRWRARLQGRRGAAGPGVTGGAPTATLVPVAVRSPPAMAVADGANDCAVVVLAGGVRIEVRELNGTSRSWVAQLLGIGSDA